MVSKSALGKLFEKGKEYVGRPEKAQKNLSRKAEVLETEKS